jgi:hypothetical protein
VSNESRIQQNLSQDLNSKHLDTPRHSLAQRNQKSLSVQPASTLAELPEKTSLDDRMVLALEQVGLTEYPIANKLKEIMENAITSTPD